VTRAELVEALTVERYETLPGPVPWPGDDEQTQANLRAHARFTVRSPKMPVGRTTMMMVNTTKVTSSEYP